MVIVRTYPRRTVLTLLCLVLAGLAEGVGISSLLPVVRVAARDGGPATDTALERGLASALGMVGLEPTTRTLFAFVFAGIAL